MRRRIVMLQDDFLGFSLLVASGTIAGALMRDTHQRTSLLSPFFCFPELQMQHAQSRTRHFPPFSSQDFSHAELTWEEGHLDGLTFNLWFKLLNSRLVANYDIPDTFAYPIFTCFHEMTAFLTSLFFYPPSVVEGSNRNIAS